MKVSLFETKESSKKYMESLDGYREMRKAFLEFAKTADTKINRKKLQMAMLTLRLKHKGQHELAEAISFGWRLGLVAMGDQDVVRKRG